MTTVPGLYVKPLLPSAEPAMQPVFVSQAAAASCMSFYPMFPALQQFSSTLSFAFLLRHPREPYYSADCRSGYSFLPEASQPWQAGCIPVAYPVFASYDLTVP